MEEDKSKIKLFRFSWLEAVNLRARSIKILYEGGLHFVTKLRRLESGLFVPANHRAPCYQIYRLRETSRLLSQVKKRVRTRERN